MRLGEKRSLLDASCCRRDVMKGGGGFLRRSRSGHFYLALTDQLRSADARRALKLPTCRHLDRDYHGNQRHGYDLSTCTIPITSRLW